MQHMEFQEEDSPFLDKYEEIKIRSHHLQHWDQQGKIQFVTFRLNDSLAQNHLKYLADLKLSFLKLNPKPWNDSTLKRYNDLIPRAFEDFLDKGYGRCILKFPEIRRIVEEALLYYDDKNYCIHGGVIMPNHVHILISMLDEKNIDSTLGALKSFTAKKINANLGESGSIWIRDNYKRLIRNLEHYKVVKAYIKENPKSLPRGSFSLIGF